MEPGFIVDNSTYGAVAQPVWATGEPQYSIWTGVKMKGRTRYQAVTYRCVRCGLLESYATEATE